MSQTQLLNHQSYVKIPRSDEPIADASGQLTHVWLTYLMGLFRAVGQSFNSLPNGAFIQQNPTNAGAPLQVLSAIDGSVIGTIMLEGTIPPPAQPQVLGSSPFVFRTTQASGTLLVSSGELEFSRDNGGTWYPIGLTGGSPVLQRNDSARVTWFGGSPPTVIWLPDF